MMTIETVTCPKCGTLNRRDTMTCQQCRINLEFALANPAMVKDITPYPMTNENIEEFRPTQARCVLAYLRYYVLAYLLIALIGIFTFVLNNGHSLTSWLLKAFFGGLGTFGFHLLFGLSRYQEHVTITISEGNISGPSRGWLHKRQAFPLERLDTGRTKRQTLTERWLGSKYIWSIDGSRIYIEPIVFEQAQVDAILNRIGL
jgi:hypothetical protein